MKLLKGGWPKSGSKRSLVLASLANVLPQIADCQELIFGFPNGRPSGLSLDVFNLFSSFQVNNVTGIDEKSTSRGTNRLEKEAIQATIGLLGGSLRKFSGNITSGGTAGNRSSIQMARDNLISWREREESNIAVICSSMVHYSIFQVCQTLWLSGNKWDKCESCKDKDGNLVEHFFVEEENGSGIRFVGVDNKGAILVKQIEERIRESYQKGIRHFIVVATTGTTLSGAVDDVVGMSLALGKLEKEFSDIKFHLHVDAAYGGLFLPFMDNSPLKSFLDLKRNYKLNGSVKEVDSLIIDPHKWWNPYPCGVVIFKKGLERSMKIQVPYLDGCGMFSPDGSRPGASAAAWWGNIAYFGFEGFKKKINGCLKNTKYFYELLKTVPQAEVFSPQLNVVCVSFKNNKNGYLSKKFSDHFFLSCGLFPIHPEDPFSHRKPRYKFVVMDHWALENMDGFIHSLKEELVK